MIIKKEKLNFVFHAVFFYFSFNIIVYYVILKLITLRTQIFQNFWNILSGSWDIRKEKNQKILLS